MSFMERISERQCRIKQYAKEYCGQPLIVYGAGYCAKGMIHFLNDHGIYDFKVCVDDTYWKEGSFADGYPVLSLKQALSSAQKPYDIIVAIFDIDEDKLLYDQEQYGTAIHSILRDDVFPHFWMKWQIFCIDRAYYEANDTFLTAFYEKLKDEASKKALISFVEQRISGLFHYSDGVISKAPYQYFEPDLVPPSRDGVVLIDGGAYDGTDTKHFFEAYGSNTFSFVVEPDPANRRLIESTLTGYPEERFCIVSKALSDTNEPMKFFSGGDTGSGLSDEGNTCVECATADDLYECYPMVFSNRSVFLKMDIEGAELRALQGARELIRNTRPLIAVCVYHKQEDIVEIPKYIMERYPDYRLYLRRYEKGFRDTVLFAVPLEA